MKREGVPETKPMDIEQQQSDDDSAAEVVAEVTSMVKGKLAEWGIAPANVPPPGQPVQNKRPPGDFNTATSCGSCAREFAFFRYKYLCESCQDAFCDDCARNYIVFGGGDYLKRVCGACLIKNSAMDYTRTQDIFEAPSKTTNTVLLIPSEQGTRYNYIYTSEELSKHYRVVAMDIPGLGSRSNEKPKRSAVLAAIKQAVETHCPTKRATVMGLSMGGYLALQFASAYPEMVDSVIMVGCNVEQYGIQQIPHGASDLMYNLLSWKERQLIVPKLYPTVDKARMNRAYLTTVMNYDHGFECANLMMEPEYETYVNQIKAFPRKILFLTGELDYRRGEARFLQAAQSTPSQPEKAGKLAIFPKVTHEVLLHQDTFGPIHREILAFLDKDVYGASTIEL